VADKIRIRQVKSGNRMPGDQRRTLRALGLKHHQDEVIKNDDPSVRGMVRKVGHLVEVEAVEE
jgi:large subunit ribosomal protein L30